METEILDLLIEEATNMLNAGTLIKNVKRSFLNRGVTSELTDKIVRIAELSHNTTNHYIAK